MINDVYFYEHCDEEYCDMGSLEFECPACNHYNIDYENHHDYYFTDDKELKINCEHCKKNLIYFYDDGLKVKISEE